MSGAVALHIHTSRAEKLQSSSATREATWVKWSLIATGVAFFAFFLLMPLIAVFVEAFRQGLGVYFEALKEPDAVYALKLTLLAAVTAVVGAFVVALWRPLSVATFDEGFAATLGLPVRALSLALSEAGSEAMRLSTCSAPSPCSRRMFRITS